jgi:ParB family chromosome partitioning protein
MSDLTNLDPRDLYQQPHLMGEAVHRIEKVIEAAAALERWDDLDKAIDILIECQGVILEWWDDHVQPAGQGRIVANHTTILTATDAADRIGADKTRVSRWRGAHKDLDTYRERVTLAARRKAELDVAANHRAEGTGENEWFTPAIYIIAARQVMGGIDLDPASHARAQETVQAARFFTKEDDGLVQPWQGRVWLNPPYAQPAIEHFVIKLVEEVGAGRASQAILLTHNYTDTRWFHMAGATCSAICFTRGRIKFVDIDGEPCAPTQGQAFFYYGPNAEAFHQVFRDFGLVLCRA